MNLSLIADYLIAKDAYHERQTRMQAAVNKAFDEYKTQKHKVSTRPYKSWPSWRVLSFNLTKKQAIIDIVYYGTYGYSEDKTIKLPIELIQLAAAGADEALHDAVAEIIRAEGEDISRREAELLEKKAQEKAQKDQENEERILAEAEEIRHRRENTQLPKPTCCLELRARMACPYGEYPA